MPKSTPYGSWKSPITPAMLASQTVRVQSPQADGQDVYWLEGRPHENGRNVVTRLAAPGPVDCIPAGFNARTRVHEYGGGGYLVSGGVLYFSNYSDQRVYRQLPGALPQPLTPPAALRYADFALDSRQSRLFCVREDHRGPGEAVNTIIALELERENEGRVLADGHNFFSDPRPSPDGRSLCYLAWDHPNMPWDRTELWVAELSPEGGLGTLQKVAGGPGESIFQPQWSPKGVLHFVSDRSGWWNLYRWREGKIEPLYSMDAEFGLPQWVFGMSTYAFVSENELACTYTRDGVWSLALLDTRNGAFTRVEQPFTDISDLCAGPGFLLFAAGSATQASSIVRYHLQTRQVEILRRSRETNLGTAYFSTSRPVAFPTADGRLAHGNFYAPQNPDYCGLPGELPPLVVMSHGGPTAASPTLLRYGIQYWTTRGFAVLDVNYGGSTGYGREYRQRLNGKWGIVDVQDCANGARYLVKQGLVDGNRLAITGSSAGGYTALAALTFTDVFSAGTSHYGICDLEALAADTHKFESRYLDSLVGPYPEAKAAYIERSPICHTGRLSTPLLLLQGAEDPVVPPNQARMMFDAVKKKGLPVACLLFEGEQHGFRKAENIIRAAEAELYFYGKIFGFIPADEMTPIEIHNLG
jgi:dipeptidyl aminopeptidase/acylaminoacyl peptidase